MSEITGRMFATLFEFCLGKGIERIVGVTDVRCERVLRRAGVFIERFGPPKKMGNTWALAGSLEVNVENLERVRGHERVDEPLAMRRRGAPVEAGRVPLQPRAAWLPAAAEARQRARARCPNSVEAGPEPVRAARCNGAPHPA